MAVVYKCKHHRNPSGRNNKIKWLLSISEWNLKEMERVATDVARETGDGDWYIILAHAELRRQHAIDLDKQVITDLEEYLKRHTGRPPYIAANIADIISYIRECNYSQEDE